MMGAGKIIFTAMLCGCAAFFVGKSIHWHWMFDESVFHYINFLMDHGKVPYRDIIDINMPGAYFIDGWAIRVFGSGDLGWRLYEYLLLAVLMASAVAIARPYDWFGGVLGGGLFALVHALDGPQMATERDEIMTVLTVAGYAFLFSALRRRLFFPVEGAVRSPYWSDLFWKQIHENPPKVLILTTEMMTGGGRMGRFDKLKRWPEFKGFLDENYRVERTRQFGERDFMTAYRIYVLKEGGVGLPSR